MKVLEGIKDRPSEDGKDIMDKVLKVLDESEDLDEVDWDTSIAQTDYGTVTPKLLIRSLIESLLMYDKELRRSRDVHKARGNNKDVKHYNEKLHKIKNFQRIKQSQLGDHYR